MESRFKELMGKIWLQHKTATGESKRAAADNVGYQYNHFCALVDPKKDTSPGAPQLGELIEYFDVGKRGAADLWRHWTLHRMERDPVKVLLIESLFEAVPPAKSKKIIDACTKLYLDSSAKALGVVRRK